MTRAVRIELVAVAAGVVIVALVRARLPRTVAMGDLFMTGAVVLLLQGLVRDVGRLRAARRERANPTWPARRVTCMCVESTLGCALIAAGAILTLAWTPWPVLVAPIAWPLAFAGVTSFGLATRDLVLDWRAGRVRREADHGAVVRFGG